MAMIDKFPGDLSSIDSLEIYIAGQEGRRDEAIETLSKKSDPVSIRRRYALLLDADRLDEIAKSALEIEPSTSWVELAVYAMAATGERNGADRLFAWARRTGDRPLEFRCAVLLADGSMRRIFRVRPDGFQIVPGGISGEDVSEVRQLDEALSLTFACIASQRKVETEIEAQFLIRQIDIAYLLGDSAKATQVCKLLLTRKPIPVKLGQTVIQGLCTEDAPIVISRLRAEHEKKFRPLFLACVIEARVQHQREQALANAIAMVHSAQSNAEREELCELIYELSAQEANPHTAEITRITRELLGADARLLKLFEADALLLNGGPKDALKRLESIDGHDDPRWLRLRANATLKSGDRAQALSMFVDLGEIAPEPEVFRMIARLANEEEQEEVERVALTRLLALVPDDIRGRERLAKILVQQQKYLDAASHLKILHRLKPDDEIVVVNLAVSYAFAGYIPEALSTLELVQKEIAISLPILTTKAQVLQAAGRAEEGFEQLALGKDKYWNAPTFLLAYMTLAYATGKEEAANEALVRLQDLQSQGEVDGKLMQQASLEDVTTWLSSAAERDQKIKQLVREGKMPWVMAAEMQREVPYWAWQLKTQELQWCADDPDSRTAYSIYSTNSFRAFVGDGGLVQLVELSCPIAGTPVAIDISTLITLHALDLLTVAAEYFGTIYVPAAYLKKALDHARELVPHQLSQKATAEAIALQVQVGRIHVSSKPDCDADIAIVDEYADEAGDGVITYRLRDVLTVLSDAGFIDDERHEQALRIAHKSAVDESAAPKLTLARRIRISELTLGSICALGLLEVLLKAFDVELSTQDFQTITSKVRAFGALEQARMKHHALWSVIRADARFKVVPVGARAELQSDSDDERDLALASTYLAKEQGVCLFVDDRVCQAVVLNERKDQQEAAFGTDQFIRALLSSNRIEIKEAADHVLQLLLWRYKFVVVRPEILKEFSDRYRGHPPGEPLRRIARYVHDCMQDVGLFGGMEATEPPTSIAVRLHQTWAYSVAEFLLAIWMDPSAPEAYAERITDWAANELLPSPPRILNDMIQNRISSFIARAVISRFLIMSSSGDDVSRINRGLRCLAEALGVDEREYMSIVAGVLNATSK